MFNPTASTVKQLMLYYNKYYCVVTRQCGYTIQILFTFANCNKKTNGGVGGLDVTLQTREWMSIMRTNGAK